jgi:glycosyltransferase involved in cell wall biosynthesis
MISVVITTYNSEKWIEETIQSVIVQKPETEILIIDDWSTDRTIEIVNELKKTANIRLFKTHNRSYYPNPGRNIGIDNAKGDYIAFLDHDDIWFPNKLERQLELIKDFKQDLAYSFYVHNLAIRTGCSYL